MSTPFTVFVTSKRIAGVVHAIHQIRDASFVVCTREEMEVPSLRAAVEDQNLAATVAHQTIDAIKSADAVVVLNGVDWGRCMTEEKGIAVAFDKPVITVDSGCYAPASPFDFHPRVRPFRSRSVEEAISRLVALRDGTPQPPQSDMFLPPPSAAPAPEA